MQRREFLRVAGLSLGALSAGGLLSACGGGPERIVTEPPTLSWLPATFHPLAGEDQHVVFGLRDLNNEPVDDADPEVYVLNTSDEILGGPFETEWHPEAGGTGLYLARVSFDEAGTMQTAAVVGDDHGKQTFQVASPEESEVPAPGTDAVSVATPTEDDHGGVAELCTREPDCGAHHVSLDDALADGRPVMLLFATPAYCQTAVCGPAVDLFEDLRTERDWDDLVFVHSEIFASPPTEGEPVVAEPVDAWRLPSEPWLFAIDRDGTVVDRLDGAIIGSVAESMAKRLV